jgi:WD40 repeat protein
MFDNWNILKIIFSYLKVLHRAKLHYKINNKLLFDISLRFDTTLLAKYILRQHFFGVLCVMVLPNGNLISSSDDRRIIIWDAKDDYKCVKIITGHSKEIYSLLYFENGDIISGSADKTVKFWSASKDYNQKFSISCAGEVTALLALPNNHFACLYGDKIGIIDCSDNFKFIQTIELDSSVPKLYFLGKYLVVPRRQDIKLYDCNNKYKLAKVKKVNNINTLVQLKDGQIAAGTSDRKIHIWDGVERFNLVKTLEGHEMEVISMIVLSGGDLASSDFIDVRLWDHLNNYELFKVIKAHTGWIWSMVVLPENRFITGSGDSLIKIWDIEV